MLRVTMLLLLVSVPVLATEVASAPPEWAIALFQWVEGMPYVGPAIGWFVKVAGFVAAILTVISAFIWGLAESLKQVTTWAGMGKIASKVDEVTKKILPFLQYLSMFNVQKKPKNG